ncbi:RHS repeat-associated core domain-containing protein [Streptomyces lannensis]|uniref:RHS repeat-associated core domain-containing protein n=1 Tax=Streptomyces lannensis TaxID=766498 RepID=A0ABP7LJF9_9ACTN
MSGVPSAKPRARRWARRRIRAFRAIALSLAAYLLAGLLGGPVAAAAELNLLGLKKPDPVPTAKVKPKKASRTDHAAKNAWKKPPKVSWPAPGTTAVTVSSNGSAADVGSLPVKLRRSKGSKAAGPERAQIQVLDRKTADALGTEGLLLAIRPTDGAKGRVTVDVDYSGFRHAYGGDWASRLTLRQLPACALTTPKTRGCAQGAELKTSNNTTSGILTGTVSLPTSDDTAPSSSAPVGKAPMAARSATGLSAEPGTVLLAATAAVSGASGNFGATSLAPSASWSAGGSNGGFSWDYGIDTPEVPGGVAPQLSLGYSSQSIDGRTAATNNQANWIGDGWSMEPGYIERQYISCTDDKTGSNNTTAKVGDQCWKKDNAVLNLGGQSNTLIRDTTSGEWHLESDDGTKVEKLTSTSTGNGDDNGEYWKVTTPDGTQYLFGYNRLPGWTSGKPETKSTWTVPVFGNHTGEPCYAAEFKDAWCQQAWRWNLDYVVDPHADAMAYYWTTETNYYGRNVNPNTGASTATAYDRGGYLSRIEYGLRANSVYSAKAAGKVDFTVTERCLTDCGTFDSAHAKNWPDVPFDRYCASGTECKDRYSPSFWTRKRLSQIDTSILTGGLYKPVDTWTLTHQFPSPGDGTDPALWLASITRTGHTGTGDVSMPPVTFRGQTLPNRVEGATTGGDPDPVPPMWRYRIYGIDTESGGTIGVTYSPTDCAAGDVPSPSSNTRRCYPIIWSPPDAPDDNYEPYLDWFHTYVVTQVLESDNTGGAPVKQTDYTYLGGMAWAKSKDDEFTQAKHLTYSDRKGYGRVQVRSGAGSDARTLKEYLYFRGIEGAEVKDSEGIAVTDQEAFAGMMREDATYNGDDGELETTVSYEPWRSAATATETRTEGLPARYAYAVGGKSEKMRTAVGAGWRTTQTARTFDAVGQPLTESDLGDTAKSGDEECATTTYARNTTANILTLIAEIKTVAKPCGTTPSLPADLISIERHYYDGATSLNAAPTKGDVTRLEEQDEAGTGYLTTATHTYDQHGRELTETDALNNTTTTTYTPATTEAPTSQTVTNALGHTTTTTYDPTRGVATAVVDANDKRTDADYDGLGRTRKVWQQGWPKTGNEAKPSVEYIYKISKTEANAVTTKALKNNGDYNTTYALYDGLLRERQTQAPAIGTQNTVVTETHYDTRGWAWKAYDAYYAEVAPSATLFTAKAVNEVPAATQNDYDGLGRITAAKSLKFGDEQWRTTTVYDGDRVTVIPPKGGTATTTVTDAKGRTTELLQYTNAERSASQKTTYGYGKYDEPTTVNDPAGNTWTYTFDNRGQQTRADDPDKGISTTTYDKLGRPVTLTDARGTTLTTVYDKLGRTTETKQGTTTLAKWTYDTLDKGQLTSSTRYAGGAEYTTATGGYNDRYQPTSTTVTIPTAAGGLQGTYTWTYGYVAETGALEWTLNPAVGDVPSERVTTSFNSDDLPFRTSRAGVALVANTLYDIFSRPERIEFSTTLGKKVYQSRVYDEHTGRLTQQVTDRDLAPQRVDDMHYAYDPAGNVTGLTTISGQDTQRSVDSQCFSTDPLGRLTEAWTTTTNCTAAPSASSVGGPDAYWHTYKYDAVGNRTEQTEHGTGASAGADATTTYTHPTPKGDLPHAVQQAVIKGGSNDGQTSSFTYDEAGNTKKRTIGTRTQDLTWDTEGHLATLTEAGKTTSYLYDADGNRLIAKNGDGSSTLTLPGGNELHVAAGGTKTGTRYYTHNGETVGVRQGTNISYLHTDDQGTAMTAIATATLAITRRKQLPFGGLRSEQSTAFGTRGFVGGINDPTGLTHLGAREYDPTLGRFLSVDPVIDHDDPAQMNAYSYAHNSPLTKSDPDGLRPDGPAGGATYNDDRWADDRGMTAGYTKKNGKWVWKQTPKKDKESQKRYRAYRANPSTYKVYHYNAKAVAAAKAQAQAKKAADERKRKDADERKRKAEAEQRKKDGIWGNVMKGNFDAAWDNSLGSRDWWNHKGVDIGITLLAAIGTGACIATVVCGGGLFLVGAGALFTAGLGAHMAVATEEQRQAGATQFLTRTAKAEIKGMAAGALWGRGPVGGIFKGANGKYASFFAKRDMAGSYPLLYKVPRGEWPAKVEGYVRNLF